VCRLIFTLLLSASWSWAHLPAPAINPAPALSQVLVRVKPDGSQTLYVHGLGLLYEVATNGTTRTYHYDYVGSTVAITDDI
jgi:hypothetical protein